MRTLLPQGHLEWLALGIGVCLGFILGGLFFIKGG